MRGPQPVCLRLVAALIAAVLVLLAPAHADTLRTRADRAFDPCRVDRFEGIGPGDGYFWVSLTGPGHDPTARHPVELAHVASVVFRPRGASGSPGREAHLSLHDGREFPAVIVDSARLDGDKLTFYMRPAGTQPGSEAFPVLADDIRRLEFQDVPPEPLAATATPVERRPVVTVTPEPVTEPTFNPFLPNPELFIGAALNDPAPAPQVTPQPVAPQQPAPVAISPYNEEAGEAVPEQRSPQLSDKLPGFLTYRVRTSVANFMLPAIPIMVWLVFFPVGSLVAAVTLLIMSKSNKSLGDLTFGRAIGVGVAAATIPMIAYQIVSHFIIGIGGPIGLVGAWFVMRAVVMGGLELLEEESMPVTITMMVILFGTLVVLTWGGIQVFGFEPSI